MDCSNEGHDVDDDNTNAMLMPTSSPLLSNRQLRQLPTTAKSPPGELRHKQRKRIVVIRMVYKVSFILVVGFATMFYVGNLKLLVC